MSWDEHLTEANEEPTRLTFQCPHCRKEMAIRAPRSGQDSRWFRHACHVALAVVKVSAEWRDTYPASEVPENARIKHEEG